MRTKRVHVYWWNSQKEKGEGKFYGEYEEKNDDLSEKINLHFWFSQVYNVAEDVKD